MTKNSFVVELTFKEGGFGKKKGARGGGGVETPMYTMNESDLMGSC